MNCYANATQPAAFASLFGFPFSSFTLDAGEDRARLFFAIAERANIDARLPEGSADRVTVHAQFVRASECRRVQHKSLGSCRQA